MNRRIVLIVLGLLIILTPYAGMPSGARGIVTQILGLLVLLTPFVVARGRKHAHLSKEQKTEKCHTAEEIDEMVDMG